MTERCCRFGNNLSQDPEMHLIRPDRLVVVQFHHMLLNLLFVYTERDFNTHLEVHGLLRSEKPKVL